MFAFSVRRTSKTIQTAYSQLVRRQLGGSWTNGQFACYWRYMDDICLNEAPSNIEIILNALDNAHSTIRFTKEQEMSHT